MVVDGRHQPERAVKVGGVDGNVRKKSEMNTRTRLEAVDDPLVSSCGGGG